MIRRAAAVAATAAALLAARPAAASVEPALAGLAVGAPIASAAALIGMPTAVASLDAGHRFDFPAAAAYVDDDGAILAVEMRAGVARIPVDGVARAFPIGTYSRTDAERQLADVAEFAGPALRSYRIAPQRDLILDFGTGERLVRLAYGGSGQLARLGLLPGDPAARAVPYHAPVARTPASFGAATVPREARVYRIAVDRGGAVTRVELFLPAPPAAPGADPVSDPAAGRLAAERFRPATLGDRPIASTVFVEVRP